MNIAVYPGTFDPFTNGHKDLVQRAATNIFDKVYVCIAANSNKDTVFSLSERINLTKKDIMLAFKEEIDASKLITLVVGNEKAKK